MAYALGIGQSDKRDQSGAAPSQASGLTTASSNTASPLASNNQSLNKNVGSTQSAGTSNTSQAPGVANSASKSPDDFTKSNFANTSAIVDRNQGADQSGITNKITSDAQNQANNQISTVNKKGADYLGAQTTKFGQQYAAASPDEVNKVASGDQTATDRLHTLLYGAVGQPDQFDAGTQDPIKANEYLKNGDITSVLMNRGSQDYTSGMGALDNLMFGKAGGFNDVGRKVQDLQSGVQNAVGAATNKDTGYGAQAQSALNNAVTTGRANTRSSLQNVSDTITNNAKNDLAAAQAKYGPALEKQRADERNQAGGAIASKVTQLQQMMQDPVTAPAAKDALAKLMGTLGISDANKLPTDYSNNTGLDQFIKYNPANLDINDFVTQGNAKNFNNINSLLESGQSYKGQTGPLNTGSSIYDENSLNNYVNGIYNPAADQAASLKDAANREAQAEAARQAAAAQASKDVQHAQASASSGTTYTPNNSGPTQGPGNMDSTNAQAGVDQVNGGNPILEKPINWVGDKFAHIFGW